MKRLAILLILPFVTGCSKEIQNNRALEGDWKSVDLSVFDYSGLKTKPECTGNMQFNSDGKRSSTGTYRFSLYFEYNGSPLNFVEQGTYYIENKNSIKLLSSDGEETIATLVYHTKEDLVLDFPNVNYLAYYIVLKK